MGGAASRVAGRTPTGGRAGVPTSVARERTNTAPGGTTNTAAPTMVRIPVTSDRVEGDLPRSKTTQEWSDLLNSISGSISSRTWDGTVGVPVRPQSSSDHHVAQRSKNTLDRLPSRVSEKHGIREATEFQAGPSLVKPQTGRLTQNQVLAIYRLVRETPTVATAEHVSKTFHIDVRDAADLLKYNRTIVPHLRHGNATATFDPERGIIGFEDVKLNSSSASNAG